MIQGGLFTRDFPLEGVTAEPAWRALSAGTLESARARLETLLAPLVRQRAPNEAETEAHLVFPVLEHCSAGPTPPHFSQTEAGAR